MSERNLDFDKIIDRYGTNSLKYDFAAKRGMAEDLLPLWVADMDFRISSYIQDALIAQAEHGIYGYTDFLDNYYKVVNKWVKEHYGYEVSSEEIINTPGVVFAIAMAIQAYTKEDEAVLIQQPVYYPFSGVIRDNNRKLVSNDLVYDKESATYSIDFDDFERKIKENNVKLFVLCNPHNPVGKAWCREDLIKLGNICKKNGVVVLSDEIHADFNWKDGHNSFWIANEEFKEISIIATAPSKTFNIAGLQVSNIFIKNAELRNKFKKTIDASGYSQLNSAGIIAAQAAYEHGQEWYEGVKSYIKSNIDYMAQYIKENIPKLKMVNPEATYLTWVDCSDLGLSEKELEELVIKDANLWLDGGYIFGKTGSGFQRFNVACPREILTKALEQLKSAIDGLS